MEENQTSGSIKHYDFKGTYGVTDLLPESPYEGEWGIYSAHFGVKEKQYLKDPEAYDALVRKRNESYLAELHASGKFGQEYTIGIDMMHNPLFDEPKNNMYSADRPMESYRMVFIDNSEYNNE